MSIHSTLPSGLTVLEVTQLGEALLGTCRSLDQGIADLNIDDDTRDIDTSEAHSEISDEVELCEGCGWWCEVGELELHRGGDLCCEDCRDEED